VPLGRACVVQTPWAAEGVGRTNPRVRRQGRRPVSAGGRTGCDTPIPTHRRHRGGRRGLLGEERPPCGICL